MKIKLFDFQKDALQNLRKRLLAARPAASPDTPQAITLAAPTGSGKTVIMTALFEAILDMPDDQLEWPLDWQPQPDAVILWVSDNPELNEQTRRKIERQSDKVNRVAQLQTIDSTFDAERLQGGRIYFINTQKLAGDRLLSKEGDGRQTSIWKTFSNTARAIPDRFYVVIDEAHRGMASARGNAAAQSIVQQFIKGNKDSGLIKMPLIIGVSATPKRFTELLAETEHTHHPVRVPVDHVRESGLIKARVLIHHPMNETNAELGILEEAARRWKQMSDQWSAYCDEENEKPVRPILVIQVEDGTPTKTNLADAIKAVEDGIGRKLNDAELAHSLMDKGALDVGAYVIRHLEPSRIEDDPKVSVVFFKMALSTGWDCPRAEVMMSFRAAHDHTYIAQLLGRMVRTPLARRIENYAELNDVHLFVPNFNTETVKQVISALQASEDMLPAVTGEASKLVTLQRNKALAHVFDMLEAASLVTYRVNAVRAQNNIRRYQEFVRRLTMDGIAMGAWDQGKTAAVDWMTEQVQALQASGQLDKARERFTKVGIRTQIVAGLTGLAEGQEEYTVDASDMDIDRQYEEAGRVLGQGHGLHQLYRKDAENIVRDGHDVKLEVIALAASPACRDAIEKKSEQAFRELYQRHRSAIDKLHEQSRAGYERLRSAAKEPDSITWRLPESIDFRRETDLTARQKHLYCDDDGNFRAGLNAWEARVLDAEMRGEGFLAWFRNLDRKPWSFEMPYEVAGEWKPMFPDLLVIRIVHGVPVIDILEPHDPSLADNVYKARGLALFAKRHGGLFGSIKLIREKAGAFIHLDMNNIEVQDKVSKLDAANTALDLLFEELGER